MWKNTAKSVDTNTKQAYTVIYMQLSTKNLVTSSYCHTMAIIKKRLIMQDASKVRV